MASKFYASSFLEDNFVQCFSRTLTGTNELNLLYSKLFVPQVKGLNGLLLQTHKFPQSKEHGLHCLPETTDTNSLLLLPAYRYLKDVN
jgi:hypothetical protein